MFIESVEIDHMLVQLVFLTLNFFYIFCFYTSKKVCEA